LLRTKLLLAKIPSGKNLEKIFQKKVDNQGARLTIVYIAIEICIKEFNLG